jgi:hypothetical protein
MSDRTSPFEIVFYAFVLLAMAGMFGGIGHLAGDNCEHQQHDAAVVEK